jgi:hypothetical protein
MAVEGEKVASITVPGTQSIGFLTIAQENHGYSGGYLVTNLWGRPLEFRLSTAVQPNRVQQILYGRTLQGYICGDLIGKTLVEKTGTAVQCIFTDCEAVLDLRMHMDLPVVWLAPGSRAELSSSDPENRSEQGTTDGKHSMLCHPRFSADHALVRELLDRLEGTLDLTEPFLRIREAIGEARKMGATSRS